MQSPQIKGGCHTPPPLNGVFLVVPRERPKILPEMMPPGDLFPELVGALRAVLGRLPRGEGGRTLDLPRSD